MVINTEEKKWESEDFGDVKEEKSSWAGKVEQKFEEHKNEFTGDIMKDVESITKSRFSGVVDKNASNISSILMLSGYYHLDQVEEAVRKYCKITSRVYGKTHWTTFMKPRFYNRLERCIMHGQYYTRLKDLMRLVNKNEETEKTDAGTTSDEYLPIKSDCERAIEKLKDETAKDEFDVANVLKKLEVLLDENGKILHKDWKEITIDNLKTWFS